VCPLGEEKKLIAYNDETEKDKSELLDSVYEIIDKFCDDECYNEDFTPLKPGETFESVLEALFEFQKGLLPKDVYISFFELKGQKTICFHNSNQKNSEGFEINFYDPATSVITITSWEGEA
jgi:hypothetical protein